MTNQGHRLIWRQIGNVVVLLLFGEHDAVYRRAERLRLEIDDTRNILRVVDEDPGTGGRVPYAVRRADEGRLFMAWNNAELTGFGFTTTEIAVLRRLNTDDDLLSLDGSMRAESWQAAMNLAMYGHPNGEQTHANEDSPAEVAVSAESTDAPAKSTVTEALNRSTEFVPVPANQLAEVLARPIEDWMLYLDPAQQGLVERNYTGPARIRGAAGTGKTVVALHRARALAKDGKRILFTTYVRNLPTVYKHLFARLAPDEQGRVEFMNVHGWALRYLHRNGVHPRIDQRKAEKAWRAAFREVVTDGSALKKARLTESYLKDEVEWVIRGRSIDSLDAYLALERSGRGTPLAGSLRQEVWRLAGRYTEELDSQGVHDFTRVLLDAYRLAKNSDKHEYDAVIVDEAQDLTEVALRLLYALVGDQPNGLLLVGDGQQSVYPGGFNLSALGVQVVGRSHVLTRNYRNTYEIYTTAHAVVEAARLPEDEGQPVPELSRRGPRPVIVTEPTEESHDLALASAVEAALDSGTGPGDLAVLVPTHSLADRYAELLTELDLPTQSLKDYDGNPNSFVKIGTYLRAKGLEFKQVFLPRLDAEGLREACRPDEDEHMHRERLDLLRRQLFVAMSRARDVLWLGMVAEPSGLLPASLLGSQSELQTVRPAAR
ncbi:MAG TPA: UvrD-helicase domain-containing protein [Micromonosporaceae bacterium]